MWEHPGRCALAPTLHTPTGCRRQSVSGIPSLVPHSLGNYFPTCCRTSQEVPVSEAHFSFSKCTPAIPTAMLAHLFIFKTGCKSHLKACGHKVSSFSCSTCKCDFKEEEIAGFHNAIEKHFRNISYLNWFMYVLVLCHSLESIPQAS